MAGKRTPLTIDGINESIYAGFWTRLGSLLLDFLIVLPYVFLVLYLNGLSKNAYYFTFILGLIFHFWFSIYLVKKYGGTPGKLIVGIKIIKLDGTDVTWREAILRQIVNFILTIFGSVITIIALSKADSEYYESLTWMTKQQYLFALIPVLFKIYTWSNNIWVYSELLVLLFNKRKRAVHDFIADTVIVKTKYIDKIRETMNETNSLTNETNEDNASS
ncbi:MAG: RDD family protein [Cyclobacteriaceae bacterium]|nr:RDD family protein [Cyclobacteriaceae bacterium]